jgi:uncharacterized protein (DUF1501 family)
MTTRRDFLQQAGAAALAASALPGAALAGPPAPQPPTLIAVYLRGGADPLSAVVPFADKDYPRHRPSLALATADVLPLDDRFGFNRHLKELHALYQKGQCVPVVAVGSPDPTRSHFDAQDFMERGAPGLKTVGTGWLNRYLQATRSAKEANLRAVSLQPLLPRSLRGAYPVLARPERDAELAMALYAQQYLQKKPRAGANLPSLSAGQQTRQAIQEFGARTIEQLWELSEVLEHGPPPAAKYPQTGFGRQMRDIARLIKARRGLEVTALDYGAWDHHINEGPLDGQMARQLADVSGSIGAFADDLGSHLFQNVLVMSEFGRTVKENNNRGTDHGHGGFMLAVGGKLNGRQVYGRWTGLDEPQLYEGRDLPAHTDFRVVFAEVLQGHFGFDGIKAGLFPKYTPHAPPLHFLRDA